MHPAAAWFTVIPAMLSMANTTHTLFHGGTIAVPCVSVWPPAMLAQRTSDATSGV